MSFSIQSSFDSAGPGWVMGGSADSEAVAFVVQMMALLWGQEPLHWHSTVTPHPALFPTSQHVFEPQFEASFEIYLCYQAAISYIGTRSGLQLNNVDRERNTGHTYRDRLFLGQCCYEHRVYTHSWHVKTCVRLPWGHNVSEICVTCSASAALWSRNLLFSKQDENRYWSVEERFTKISPFFP